MNTRAKGFTLIEIAIVLVIIGLLLGGVLKGQELITGARVRNLVAQQDGVKAAYFGFLDRYRALPGDYSAAAANISNIVTTLAACGNGNGNGNGQIQSAVNNEHLLVWEHLAKAGFINGSYTCAAAATNATSPSNPYGGLLELQFDAAFANGSNRHNLKTGGSVPSDILAEVDRKVDDGNPGQGSFRATPADPADTCATDAPPTAWVTTNPGNDCAGTTLF
ncbi:MAG TPA: prepilin-type N-terminal cleavage/methylation domain-containing protein [Burkholderiales bacterium]|nr:prepilin-type N-terminal cleavage/methylation domain-containing protein [Burkholderiales bacterium]